MERKSGSSQDGYTPDGVTPPTTDRVNSETALSSWWPTLSDLDVPTPETRPLELDTEPEGMPEWDTERAVEIVSELGGEAFLRGELTAGNTRHRLVDDPTAIDEAIAELLADHVMMQYPHGSTLFIREWLELDRTDEDEHSLFTKAPEVRFFCRAGVARCAHLRMDCMNHPGEEQPPAVHRAYEAIIQDSPTLWEYADTVATAFQDDMWVAADFVQDVDGQWWVTDLAQDALRWDNDEEKWVNTAAHPAFSCRHDLERWSSPPAPDE